MKEICLTVLLFCSSFVSGQSALNILDLYHESFSDTTARVIKATARVGDYAYHMNIAGIAFQEVASPAANIQNKNISLDFSSNRLQIRIGAKSYYSDLPVWQLVPIVRFADSPYNVVVSQIGDTIGNREARCRFHPAFLDNLLGLRLFQADLLNLIILQWDIPINAQRNYISAPSEQSYIPHKDSILYRIISEKLLKGEGFTSYVLTDKDIKFVFDADESGFKISGQPYYYFTKMKVDQNRVKKLQEQLINCYNDIDNYSKIILGDEYVPALNPRTGLGDLVAALSKHKQEKIFNAFSWQKIEDALTKIDSLNDLTNAQVGIQFQVLDNYTESFKPYWAFLKKYNPLVYSAVENTAQWSAFFRYVRKTNPDNWAQFVNKLEQHNIPDAPDVRTPTSTDLNYFRFFFDDKKK